MNLERILAIILIIWSIVLIFNVCKLGYKFGYNYGKKILIEIKGVR